MLSRKDTPMTQEIFSEGTDKKSIKPKPEQSRPSIPPPGQSPTPSSPPPSQNPPTGGD